MTEHSENISRNEHTLVSIIIPIYNAEKYLRKCVDSVISQTEKNWELILVNDGSKDQSGKICDEYAQLDKRIRVIHKANGGVSSARNMGIDSSSGKYLVFIDSDDWVDEAYISHLIDNESDASLVVCGHCEIHSDSRKINGVPQAMDYPLKDLKQAYDELLKLDIISAPWAKRYTRALLGKLRFDEEMKLGEDCLFNLLYMDNCASIRFLPYSDYNYNLINFEATTKKLRLTDFDQTIKLYRAEKRFKYSGEQSDALDSIDRKLFLTVYYLMQKLCRSKPEGYREILKEWMNQPDFRRACKGSYELPFTVKLMQFLCRTKCCVGFRAAEKLKCIIKNQ